MDRQEFIIQSTLMLIIVGAITIIGNTIGYDFGIIEAIPGMMMIIAIGLVSLILARELPYQLPAFAWAIFIATLLALPFSPVQGVFLEYTDRIEFLATATPILAYAGLAVALQADRLKQVGWQLVIVALVAFFASYIGSAIIAELVLRYQGVI
jgi:hypothetical protein